MPGWACYIGVTDAGMSKAAAAGRAMILPLALAQFIATATAYPSRHNALVYSPVIGGKPTRSAYAMPCGTSSVLSTIPATRSLASHSRR